MKLRDGQAAEAGPRRQNHVGTTQAGAKVARTSTIELQHNKEQVSTSYDMA